MNDIINTDIPGLTLRFAEEGDTHSILELIKELAEYENLSHEVVVEPERLRNTLFGKQKYAEVILAVIKGKAVGFALFFHNFSTFLGRPGIYLEDLYVKESCRRKGIGKTLLSYLVKLAVERDCGRLEWAVLDWNEPAINFYKRIGAQAMDEWTVYRLNNSKLAAKL